MRGIGQIGQVGPVGQAGLAGRSGRLGRFCYAAVPAAAKQGRWFVGIWLRVGGEEKGLLTPEERDLRYW